MNVNNVAVCNYPNNVPSPFQQLLDLYSQVSALFQDLKENPQNALDDLNKLVDLAQQMDAIASKMPNPPSAPNFHADFEGLVSYFEEMKSSLLSGVASDPSFAKAEQDAGKELANIFFDIMQG